MPQSPDVSSCLETDRFEIVEKGMAEKIVRKFDLPYARQARGSGSDDGHSLAHDCWNGNTMPGLYKHVGWVDSEGQVLRGRK